MLMTVLGGATVLAAAHGVLAETACGAPYYFFFLPSTIVLSDLTARMQQHHFSWAEPAGATEDVSRQHKQRQVELDHFGMVWGLLGISSNVILGCALAALNPRLDLVMAFLFLFMIFSLGVRIIASALYLIEPWYKQAGDALADGTNCCMSNLGCGCCLEWLQPAACLPCCCPWRWTAARLAVEDSQPRRQTTPDMVDPQRL